MKISHLFLALALSAGVLAMIPVKDNCGSTEGDCLEYKSFSFKRQMESVALEKRIENLNKWMRKAGISKGGVEVRASGDKGLGLFATEFVTAEDEMFSVPSRFLFKHDGMIGVKSFKDLSNEQISHFYEFPPLKISDDHDSLAVALLYHAAHSENSYFKDYIAALPTDKTYGYLQFDEEILQIIKDDKSLIEKINDSRRLLVQFYKRIKQQYEGTFNAEQRNSYLKTSTITQSDYFWAKYIIDSRGWTIEGKKMLVPVADFINHESTTLKTHPWAILHKLDNETGDAVIYAERSTTKDGEIFETYGEQPNSHYLLHYGFVPDNNKVECIEIPLITQEQYEKMSSIQRRFAFTLGFGFVKCLTNDKDTAINLALLNNVMTMKHEEAEDCFYNRVGQGTNDNDDTIKILVNDCANGPWEVNMAKVATTNLNKQLDSFTEIYEALGKAKSPNKEFVAALRKYYNHKAKLTGEIIAKVRNVDQKKIYARFQKTEL